LNENDKETRVSKEKSQLAKTWVALPINSKRKGRIALEKRTAEMGLITL